MKKHPLKRTAALFLSLAILCPTAGISAMAAGTQRESVIQQRVGALAAVGLQAKFTSEYAKVGEPLTVEVSGAPEGTQFTYAWTVDNVAVKGNNTNTYTPSKNDVEHFIQVTVSASGYEKTSASIYCSRLPVIYINTKDNAPIVSKENYVDATLAFQGNETYNVDNTTLYDGAVEIRGRGNITWTYPKKPYKIKLDSSTNLLGMGKSKHWVLLSGYEDGSLMRNRLAYDFSGASDMPYMQQTWVDVVLNGEYIGNYQFCEQIKISSGRVDIQNLEDAPEDTAKAIAKAEGLSKDVRDEMTKAMEENLAWMTSDTFTFNGVTYTISDYCNLPDITGGYLLELDEYYDELSQFKTEKGQPIMFKNPEFAKTNDDMMNFVKTYIQAFETAVNSSDYHASYNGQNVHYSELFDMGSLVDFWINSELFYNGDAGRKSTYMYKDVGEKFNMGPIWDMDWSSGGMGDTQATDQWWVKRFSTNAQKDMWSKRLVEDPYFLIRAEERFQEVKAAMQDIIREGGQIDQHYDYILESANANAKKWSRDNFDASVNHLRNWMTNRIGWLSQQFAEENALFNSIGTYKKDNTLTLKMTDAAGNELAGDNVSATLPANAMVEEGKQVKLTVTAGNGNVKKVGVYVNGALVDTVPVAQGKAEIILESSDLVLAQAGKNVIHVRELSSSNSALGSNYVTLLQTARETVVTELKVTPPTKLFYNEGEALDLTGMVVKAVLSDGEVIDVTSQVSVSGYDATPGVKTITVSYEDVTATFAVEVYETSVESIEIKTLPAKTTYLEGEELDLSGLVVEAVYSDHTRKVITDYEVRGYTSEPGIKTISISYDGKVATFEVKVVGLATISGVVKDVEGNPVADATVTLNAKTKGLPATAKTDAAGKYQFTDIPYGDYVLSITKDGYALKTVSVTADSHATAVEDATLEVKAVTKSTLEIVLKLAKVHIDNKDVDKLVPSVKEKYLKVYNDALAVFEDDTATQAQVDQSWKLLLNVIHALSFEAGDKSGLTDLVAQAETLKLVDYQDGAEKEAFLDALKAAQDLLLDPDALKADLDETAQTLKDAMEALLAVPAEGNKTELKKVIDIAEGYDLSKYVDDKEAKDGFASALAAANAVYDKSGAKQAEIDEAKRDLLTAMTKLRLRADKSSLQEWLDKLKAIDLSQYTAESANAVRDAIARAEALAERDLSQQEAELIQAAILDLQLAEAGLQPAAPDEPDSSSSSETSDPGNSSSEPTSSEKSGSSSSAEAGKKPTTGDSPIFAVAFLAVISAGALLVLKKREK